MSSSLTESMKGLESRFLEAMKDKTIALPIVAIRILCDVLSTSNAGYVMFALLETTRFHTLKKHTLKKHRTMAEVDTTLYRAVNELKRLGSQCGHGISVAAGCDIFVKFVTRKNLEKDNIKTVLNAMRERGQAFAEISSRSRAKIASLGRQFIRDEMTILCHGFSRVVLALLQEASKTTRFNVILTEGRPESEHSALFAKRLCEDAKVPVRMILDSAVGYVMDKVDVVLLGTHAFFSF